MTSEPDPQCVQRGDLPAPWAWSSVGQVCKVQYGKGLASARRVQTGAVEVFGSAGPAGHHDEALVEQPVIVVGRKGNAGMVWLTSGPSWPIDTTYFLQPPAGLNPQFLAFQLSTRDLVEKDSSTTIPSLRRPDLEEAAVAVAPLAEQERIVAAIEDHLSRLDAAEASVESAGRRLRHVDASLVNTALEGDWPLRPLADHTVDQRYGTSAKTGSEGEVPVLRMGNIQAGTLDWTNLKYLPREHPDFPACILSRGDLLFNRTNSAELVGKSAVFAGSERPVSFASYLIRVRVDDQLLPEWVALVINSPQGRRYIDEVCTQNVGQSNVNGTKLKAFPIPVPSLPVQLERMRHLEDARVGLGRLRSEFETATAHAASLRRSILAAAFSGRLVPQDPADEPALMLLERIAAERAAASPTPKTQKKASA